MACRFICALLVASAVEVGSVASAGPLEGLWLGAYETDDRWMFVTVAIGGERETATGRIDVPERGLAGVLLRNVRADGTRLSFELPTEEGNVKFKGDLEGSRVRGSFRAGHVGGRFELVRRVILGEELTDSLVGTYDMGDGRVLLIFEARQGLAYVDYGTGRVGHLFALASDTLVSGPTVLSGYPIDTKITVERDGIGRVAAVRVQGGGSPGTRARKRSFYRVEDVTYLSGAERIAASLLVPHGAGPFPAIVMVHGSGAGLRSSLIPAADALVREGIAVVVPDRRGAGGSTGDPVRWTFDDLAADALAGVQFLKSRPEISTDQIGLHGVSLGGWVAPLAATRSPDVRFVLLDAAPAITPAAHERLRVERQMTADGFPRDTIVQALAFMDSKFDVGRTGRGWESLMRAAKKGDAEGWAGYVNVPSSLDSLVRQWNTVLSYDPLPALRQLTCPVLASYGELDMTVSPRANVTRVAEALRAAGNRDVTIQVLPRANHSFLAAENGGPGETTRLRGFVPEYFSSRLAWMRDHVKVAPPIGVAAVPESTEERLWAAMHGVVLGTHLAGP